MKNYLVKTSKGNIDLRWDKNAGQHAPKFAELTAADHKKLAAAHMKVDHKYNASLMGYHAGMSHWHEEMSARRIKIGETYNHSCYGEIEVLNLYEDIWQWDQSKKMPIIVRFKWAKDWQEEECLSDFIASVN